MPTSREVSGGRLARQRCLVFGLGLAVALLVFLVGWRSQTVVQRFEDPYFFSALGRNLARGRGFTYAADGHPTIRRAPLYPASIATLYLVAGERPDLVRLAQCVLAGGICLLVFEIGRRLYSPRAGLLAALLCAFHPMVLRYVPDIQIELLLTFLVALTVWCTVLFAERPTISRALAIGVAGAAASMVKGVVVVYPPAFAIYWIVRTLRSRQGPSPWPLAAAIFLAMGAVILPWTYRNRRVTGKFILISGNAGGEFLRGYIFAQPKYYLLQLRPYVDGELEANQMEIDLFKQQGLVWEHDEVETETVLNRAMKAKMVAEPAAFVRKFCINLFMFWYVVTSRANSLVVGALALAGWILALIGWRRARLAGRPAWPLFLPILSINIIYAVFLSLGRYSAPCIPPLMVLAAAGLDSLLPSAASKEPTDAV